LLVYTTNKYSKTWLGAVQTLLKVFKWRFKKFCV